MRTAQVVVEHTWTYSALYFRTYVIVPHFGIIIFIVMVTHHNLPLKMCIIMIVRWMRARMHESGLPQ